MSDEQYRLEVRKRDKNEPPNSLRQRGLTPGVVYGPDIENMLLAVDNEDLEDLLAQITRSSRIELNLNGESLETFIREIQYNDLTDEVIHIDFYQPNLDQPMEMDIPVIIQGEAEGEREGGILHRITNTISVKGIPTDIPEAIYVNI